MPPLPADFIHARACKLKCEKILTRPLIERVDVFRGYELKIKFSISVEQFLLGLDISA